MAGRFVLASVRRPVARSVLAKPEVELPIRKVSARAYTCPRESEESDGTFRWCSTTIVVVRITAGDHVGLGYSYTAAAAAALVRDELAGVLEGADAMRNADCWRRVVHRLRNAGRPGVGACAISAVDVALWDLKAKALGVPLWQLLGGARSRVEVYGSGGFTSMAITDLERQLGRWASEGIRLMKMKVGRAPERDEARLTAARRAAGPAVELMVDANGAYQRKRALYWAERFAEHGVTWFEEPVSSDDLAGLRLLRDRGPAGMQIAAGEYGYDAFHFRDLVGAGAVDVLQADATRCLGITGVVQADSLCWAHNLRLSSHCAPAIHAHAMCGALATLHLEYFHDHAKLESVFFDGVQIPRDGFIEPALDRPGLGLVLKEADVERYAS